MAEYYHGAVVARNCKCLRNFDASLCACNSHNLVHLLTARHTRRRWPGLLGKKTAWTFIQVVQPHAWFRSDIWFGALPSHTKDMQCPRTDTIKSLWVEPNYRNTQACKQYRKQTTLRACDRSAALQHLILKFWLVHESWECARTVINV